MDASLDRGATLQGRNAVSHADTVVHLAPCGEIPQAHPLSI